MITATEAAPRELFEEHRGLASRVALCLWRQVRLVVSPLVQAEDLEAVALEAIWSASQRWDRGRKEGGTFYGWAWRIASRRCLDYLRDTAGIRRKFRLRTVSLSRPDPLDRRTLGESLSDGSHERAAANEAPALLAEGLLRRLEPRVRALLLRLYRDGLSQVEAAEELGVSEAWVSYLLNTVRARARAVPAEVVAGWLEGGS